MKSLDVVPVLAEARLIHCFVFADAFAAEESAYAFKVVQFDKERDLSEFKGQVTVILNIASE